MLRSSTSPGQQRVTACEIKIPDPKSEIIFYTRCIETRGRKPTPTAIRVLRGNPSNRSFNDREPNPALVTENTQPTQPLSENGLKIWNRIVSNLQSVRLLTVFDLDALTRYVVLLDEWQLAVAEIRRTGRTVVRRTQHDEYEVANPRFSQMLQINLSLIHI